MLIQLFLFVTFLIYSFIPSSVNAQELRQAENLESVSGTEAAQTTTPSPAASPPPTTVQPVNLTVSPISLNLSTDPGTTTISSIRIRNNSSEPEFLTLRLSTFTANASGDAPVIRDFDTTDTAKEWITFSESEFKISPGEWKTVQLTFAPPDSAALGYFYAILIERQNTAVVEEGSSVIAGVPAILVLTEVNSPLAKRQLELVSFTATKRLYEYLPAEFKVVIRNTGNIQTLPVGDIFIDGQRTNDIGIMQLNPAKGMLLPGTERTYSVLWEDGFPRYMSEKDELGTQTRQLKWDFSSADTFRIGKFTATTLFVYDDGEKDVPTEATLSFWVVPWRLIALIIGLIVLDMFRSKILGLLKGSLKKLKETLFKK